MPRKPEADSGRPSSYRKEFAEQAAKLCQLGATDDELADFFGVHRVTVYRWKIEHDEFCNAIKSGKQHVDERVERSLFERAVGYSFDSEEIKVIKGEVVRVPVRQHVPPDTTAAIFWLKNRRKEHWRDRHEVEHGQPGEFDRLSADDLRNHLTEEAKVLGLLPPAVSRETAH